MPDPSHRPYNPMTIIRPDSLPRFWWLFPWSMARQLHRNCNALRALADKLDAEATALRSSREHWIAKHDRAYAVAMHNERVIADMESRIIRGAIIPDAHPHE